MDIVNLYQLKKSDTTMRLRRVEAGTGYLRRGRYVTTTSNFVGVDPAGLNSTGNIQLDSSAIPKVGSTVPTVVTGNFSYVSTPNTVTIYWDGTNGSNLLTVKRTDTTNEAIPKGSIAIVGLTQNTTYYAYPFLPVASTIEMGIGWSIGDVGVPQILFTSISTDGLNTQIRQDRYPLTTGALTVATTVSGAGAPTYVGGGGADGFQDYLNII